MTTIDRSAIRPGDRVTLRRKDTPEGAGTAFSGGKVHEGKTGILRAGPGWLIRVPDMREDDYTTEVIAVERADRPRAQPETEAFFDEFENDDAPQTVTITDLADVQPGDLVTADADLGAGITARITDTPVREEVGNSGRWLVLGGSYVLRRSNGEPGDYLTFVSATREVAPEPPAPSLAADPAVGSLILEVETLGERIRRALDALSRSTISTEDTRRAATILRGEA